MAVNKDLNCLPTFFHGNIEWIKCHGEVQWLIDLKYISITSCMISPPHDCVVIKRKGNGLSDLSQTKSQTYRIFSHFTGKWKTLDFHFPLMTFQLVTDDQLENIIGAISVTFFSKKLDFEKTAVSLHLIKDRLEIFSTYLQSGEEFRQIKPSYGVVHERVVSPLSCPLENSSQKLFIISFHTNSANLITLNYISHRFVNYKRGLSRLGT